MGQSMKHLSVSSILILRLQLQSYSSILLQVPTETTTRLTWLIFLFRCQGTTCRLYATGFTAGIDRPRGLLVAPAENDEPNAATQTPCFHSAFTWLLKNINTHEDRRKRWNVECLNGKTKHQNLQPTGARRRCRHRVIPENVDSTTRTWIVKSCHNLC